jgi:hypothetical protein
VHVTVFAKRAGLSDEAVRATCAAVPPEDVFSKRDHAILRLCDALHASADVDDVLHAELEREFESALRIELEPSAARFPS